MKNTILIIMLSFLFACENFDHKNINDKAVLEAFLYQGTNQIKVNANSVFNLNEIESENTGIENAYIKLIKNDIEYNLSHDNSNKGSYIYNGNDLIINNGDKFEIIMEYDNKIINAQTIVPSVVENVKLNKTEISISPITDIYKLKELEKLSLEVSWDNNHNEYYFVTINNISNNPENIIKLNQGNLNNFSLTTIPTNTNKQVFTLNKLNQYGTYKIKVYKINDEYLKLYNTLEQNSKNLNEPYTNINGGYGIFTAFSFKELDFKIIKP